MKLTHYGKREWLGSGVIALLIICGTVSLALFVNFSAGLALSIFAFIVWLAIAAFFRDPNRKIPSDEAVFVSPADGVVRDIELVSGTEENKYFDGKDALRVGIFLSVLDVHLNRAPCKLAIEDKLYKEGAFHDARDPRASKENESMLIAGTAEIEGKKFPMAVRQISGAIARRIVTPVEPGKTLQKGERYGMIKFGSRTELYLPASKDISVEVKVGDRVFGGSSIIGRVTGEETEAKSDGN